ncbi:CHAD domain protein [mine drainage metagenome]|uniref:CHAD domain protein n=1 Tax=mine drainage metagenome TaxID=410659 RepID=A0A1J5NV79_9ZZZZ
MAEALAYITGHLTDAILADVPHANLPGTPGVEAVHRMRGAVRRARSALSVFRPAVEASALATIDTGLRTLGHQLGPTRDWDVFVEETLPAIREALPGVFDLAAWPALATHAKACEALPVFQEISQPFHVAAPAES